MTTTKRPSLTPRPATKKAVAAKKQQMDDATVSLRIDDVVYTVNPYDITGSMERTIFQATGMTVIQITELMDGHPGIYPLGCFMWVAEVAAGKDVPLDDVLDSIGYGSDVEVVTREEAEAVASPEA